MIRRTGMLKEISNMYMHKYTKSSAQHINNYNIYHIKLTNCITQMCLIGIKSHST